MAVWIKSERIRFIIDFCITLALTILSQYCLLKLSHLTVSADNTRSTFITACLLIGSGSLVAIGTPCAKLLRHAYVEKADLRVSAASAELCNLLLLAATGVTIYEFIMVILTVTKADTFYMDVATGLQQEFNAERTPVLPITLAVMQACMWVRLVLMLRVTRMFGSVLLKLSTMLKRIAFYVLLWIICLLIFYSVISTLYADSAVSEERFSSILSIVESTAGNWELGFPQYDNGRLSPKFGKVVHMLFILINYMGCFAILTAVFAAAYSRER